VARRSLEFSARGQQRRTARTARPAHAVVACPSAGGMEGWRVMGDRRHVAGGAPGQAAAAALRCRRSESGESRSIWTLQSALSPPPGMTPTSRRPPAVEHTSASTTWPRPSPHGQHSCADSSADSHDAPRSTASTRPPGHHSVMFCCCAGGKYGYQGCHAARAYVGGSYSARDRRLGEGREMLVCCGTGRSADAAGSDPSVDQAVRGKQRLALTSPTGQSMDLE